MSFATVQPSNVSATGSPSSNVAGGGSAPSGVTLYRATVKQVLSGDSVIVRGQPKGGPPPEKQLNLSNITAPKLARRPTDASAPESKDEPFAWEAREFLRQKVVGKEILFVVDYKIPASGREYGMIYLGKDTSSENVAESLVAEGLVEVRQVASNRPQDEYLQRLNALQDSAKAAGKGKWGTPETLQKHVRDIKWSLPPSESPRNFVESFRREPIKAVIEHVRDGSTVRAFLLPSFHYVTVMLSGIKCPGYKIGEDGRVSQDAEPYAEEAKYFTEVRLLQKDVEIILEGVSNQNFLGTISHPNGNISEALLREGFAKCVDWSIAVVTAGPEKYRAAEKVAKEKRSRIWKSYQPPASTGDATGSFTAKVIEVVMGDALVIKTEKGAYQKIWLSSVRPPRAEDAGGKDAEQKTPGRQFRPLYDIPFMFEAREFLRKRLIGKKVQVTVDYVQASNQQFPERSCCTVTIGGQNVAEALILKGLASVVRYRQGDENRSSQYDQLLAAESKAEKSRKGIHSLKRDTSEGALPMPKSDMIPIVRVQELQGDANKSKQFFPFLQRAGRTSAVVEFVASGSRFRLYVPKETCLLTFLLSGISCPRASRTAAPGAGPQAQQYDAQPFGDEALRFVKEMCLQHEVEFEVETLDKAGNFVGYMFVSDPASGGSQKNLSVELVEHGLATVHFTAERSRHFGALKAAEDRARTAKVGLFSLPENQIKHDEEEENEELEGGKRYENGNSGESADDKEKAKDGAAPATASERAPQYRKAVITEVLPELRFYAQLVEQGPKLEQMMTDLRQELTSQPPLAGAYNPKRGDVCAARFSQDNQWYRARVELIKGREHVEVLYIDFGNREVTSANKLAALPATYQNTPPGAREFRLALVQVPSDPDYAQLALDQFNSDLWLNGQQQEVLLNVEYRVGGIEHVTVTRPAPEASTAGGSSTSTTESTATVSVDLGKRLIANGMALVEKRRPGNDRRLNSLLAQYAEAQDSAKKSRLNIWQYGDFTGDEL